jgi:hypothetical protein
MDVGHCEPVQRGLEAGVAVGRVAGDKGVPGADGAPCIDVDESAPIVGEVLERPFLGCFRRGVEVRDKGGR